MVFEDHTDCFGYDNNSNLSDVEQFSIVFDRYKIEKENERLKIELNDAKLEITHLKTQLQDQEIMRAKEQRLRKKHEKLVIKFDEREKQIDKMIVRLKNMRQNLKIMKEKVKKSKRCSERFAETLEDLHAKFIAYFVPVESFDENKPKIEITSVFSLCKSSKKKEHSVAK
jgi:hypothetical protein